MKQKDLPNLLYLVIKEMGGKGTMMKIFRAFWAKHGNELNEKEDLFYSWLANKLKRHMV